MKIERRQFLGTAVGSTAGALMAGKLAGAAPAAANPTKIVPLGKHVKASYIGCGTGMSGWMRQTNQTRMGRQKFEKLLAYCYDQDVRMFDLADLYGTMPYAGRVLAGKPRGSYTLVSKIWPHPRGLPEEDRPAAEVCIKRFLKELQTDYIDLVQIHCVSKGDWPRRFRRYMDQLADCKRKGLIKAHGVSCHSVAALEAAAAEPWCDAVHARINPFNHRTDAPMEQVVPVLKKIHAAGKGIIAMKLVGEGKFNAEQRAESLRFAMDLGCVDVLIVGFEKTAEVDEFKSGVRRQLLARTG